MHPNEALIARFYEAFQRRDAAAMGACYHRDVQFSDEIFPELHGDAARAMWTMLCERGKDLTIEHSQVHADTATGRAHWDAWYTFSGTGRRVHNAIRAEFEFRDGLIIRHRDRFAFWRWAQQALGPAGLLLGWSRFLRGRVQAQAARSLRDWAYRAGQAALGLVMMFALAACGDGAPTEPGFPPARITTTELLRRLGKPDTARLVIIHGDDLAITPGALYGVLSPVVSEVETEITAQVARARAAGLVPTHMDSHQGALLYGGAERFGALRRVAKRECLAIPVPTSLFLAFPYLAAALDDGQPPLADLVSIPPGIPSNEWAAFYDGVFETMRPGVTLLLLHLGEDTPVERLLFRDHTDYDAGWRARDAAVVTSGAIAAMAQRHGVQVVDWGDVTRVAPVC